MTGEGGFSGGAWAPKSCALVGGLGAMGRLVGRVLSGAGCAVSVFDTAAGAVRWEEAARCEAVCLAVPVSAVGEVCEALGPLSREDGLVFDVASVKEGPVREMLAHFRGEVLGCHPLFGPHAADFAGETVFLSPARGERGARWLSRVFAARGARVVEMPPRAHDRLMARVQTLRHLTLAAFGRALSRLDPEGETDLSLTGRWFPELVSLLSRQAAQPPSLYAELALGNPHGADVAREFLHAASALCEAILAGDRGSVAGAFGEAARWLATLPEDPAR